MLTSTLNKLRVFFRPVKTRSNPCQLWLRSEKQSAIYILYYQEKEKPLRASPKTRAKTNPKATQKKQQKPLIRWMASLRETIHPKQVF
ncbi:hypothetical protein, partial [Plesiomonas sp. ZOR0011]|uniref:hypothetical protein n=1 Tax=Plesiomonas sp. ZOR0011 TaxID=1339230 RepID=UPI001C439717